MTDSQASDGAHLYIAGQSEGMLELRERLARVPQHVLSVLLSGEDGVGKDEIARLVHVARASGTELVTLNCDAVHTQEPIADTAAIGQLVDLPEALPFAESSLGGTTTLFLKNVDRSPQWLDELLLRFLGAMTATGRRPFLISSVTETGGADPAGTLVNVRPELARQLDGCNLRVPPLRERKEDLREIVDMALAHIAERGGEARLAPDAFESLSWYSWPGNVRQLVSFIERQAAIRGPAPIGVRDVFEEFTTALHVIEPQDPDVRIRLPENGLNLRDFLRRVERDLIEQALDADDRVVAHAAERLNVKRSTLVEKINRLGIH